MEPDDEENDVQLLKRKEIKYANDGCLVGMRSIAVGLSCDISMALP